MSQVNTWGAAEHQALAELMRIAVPFRLDLRQRFRGTAYRVGCLIPGPSGWGEFAPFPNYSAHAMSSWLVSALEAAFGEWPEPVRHEIPVNAIIPAVEPELAATLTRQAVSVDGCTTMKVKIDGDLGRDEPRVAAVRAELDALTTGGRLRLDVNGAWSSAQALDDGLRLAEYGIEYIEQPTKDLRGLERLRARVAIAVDEGIRRDGLRTISDIADFAIIKAAPMGGVTASVTVAAELDVPVIVSGSLDSSVGLGVGLHTAAVLPALAGACGFGTGALLRTDVVHDTTLPVGGSVPAVRRSPDLDALARVRAPASDRAALLEQLRTAWWAADAPRWASSVLAAEDRAR